MTVAFSQPAPDLGLRYREIIEHYISEDLIEDALNELQDFIRDLAPQLKAEVLVLRRRFSWFRREHRKGLAPRSEADEIVRVALDLMDEAQKSAIAKPILPTGRDSRPTDASPADSHARPDLHGPAVAILASSSAEVSTEDPPEALDAIRRAYWEQIRKNRPPEETNVFDCVGIVKSYLSTDFSLGTLTFSLRIGEITGVVGRNASGKTTLLRIILGELLQDAGRVEYPLLTRDSRGWPAVKRQMAHIAQFPGEWNGTVRANLSYVAAAHGVKGRRNRQLVDWHIERYGLADYETTTCAQLSGGFRIRFELVRALISKPRLLVLDEPLAYLDVVARQEFLRNIRSIASSLEEPVPIIITSQHLYEIEAIADQMIILEGGVCRFIGSTNALAQESPMKVYEVTAKVPRSVVQRTLEGCDVKILEVTSDGYIVGFPLSTDSGLIWNTLAQGLGNRLTGARDITGSTRRLFVDVLNQKHAPEGK
jgi:ABC-2 type transport system ATP-binding protein